MRGQDAVRICEHQNREYSRAAARDEHPRPISAPQTSRSPRYLSPEVNELNVYGGISCQDVAYITHVTGRAASSLKFHDPVR